MFNKWHFIEECRAALKDSNAQEAIHELMARAVSDPTQIVRVLGEPQRAGIETIYRGDDITILNLCWGPQMKFKPHDHGMWAVIGIYGGREQNIFYRDGKHGLEQQGSRELHTRDTTPLGASIIHAVRNPLDRITGALHVYGGDFFSSPRSEWDAKTFEVHPYDVEHTIRAFEESNRLLHGRH